MALSLLSLGRRSTPKHPVFDATATHGIRWPHEYDHLLTAAMGDAIHVERLEGHAVNQRKLAEHVERVVCYLVEVVWCRLPAWRCTGSGRPRTRAPSSRRGACPPPSSAALPAASRRTSSILSFVRDLRAPHQWHTHIGGTCPQLWLARSLARSRLKHGLPTLGDARGRVATFLLPTVVPELLWV